MYRLTDHLGGFGELIEARHVTPDSGANPLEHDGSDRWSTVPDLDGPLGKFPGNLDVRPAVVEQFHDRLPLINPLTGHRKHSNARSGIDDPVDLVPSRAQRKRGAADAFRIQFLKVPGACRSDVVATRRSGEPIIVVNDPGVATLSFNGASKHVERRA
jgi:hypothetical protein